MVSLLLGAVSDGVYMDDDISHYLLARDGWTDVGALLHSWARPGYNVPAAPVAYYLGMEGARALSAAMTALTAWLAFAIARRIAREGAIWPALAPLAVWAQPLVLLLSYTTLTETPAALYLALGLWLHLTGRRVGACAAYSAMFVTRYETLALAPLLAAAVAWDALRLSGWRVGRALSRWWVWASAPALLWAPAAYLLAAWSADLPAGASPWTLLSRDYTQEYGRGVACHFLAVWPQAAGLGLLGLAACGAAWLGRRAALPSLLIAALVGLHSYLFWKGSFETGGYARFLVPLAAPLGVLAAGGAARAWRATPGRAPAAIGATFAAIALCWHWVWVPLEYWLVATVLLAGTVVGLVLSAGLLAGRPRARTTLSRSCAVLAGALLAIQLAGQIHPLDLRDDRFHEVVARAVNDLSTGPYADRPAIAQHVLIEYLRDDVIGAGGNEHAMKLWLDAEPGTLMFWENKYGYKPHAIDSTRALYAALHRWGRVVHRQACHEPPAVVEVFEKLPAPDPNAPTSPQPPKP